MKNKRIALILVMLFLITNLLQSIPSSVFAVDITNSDGQETQEIEPGGLTATEDVSETPVPAGGGSIVEPSQDGNPEPDDLNDEPADGQLLAGRDSGSNLVVLSALGAPSDGEDLPDLESDQLTDSESDQLTDPESDQDDDEESEEETIQITFDSRGGSSLEPITVEKGSPVLELPSPTMEGFTFEGWFTEEYEKVELSFSPEEDITLYAEWDLVLTNPDHLLNPDDSPNGGAIDYSVLPLTDFFSTPAMMRTRGTRSNNHPDQPCEVMLFKDAVPVDGMVNTWDVTLRIEGKNKPTTSDIVLVIDTSGSMGGSSGRMAAAIAAANAFIDTLLPSDSIRIGIVTFAGNVQVKSGLSDDATALKSIVNGLSANGGTFAQAGVKQAEAMLENSNADLKNIVLLSDGEPTYSYGITKSYLTNTSYLQNYGSYYQTSTNMPAAAYTGSRVGAGNNMYNDSGETIGTWPFQRVVYYNHGNSAIAQAGFAKAAGNRLWTVALSAGNVGDQVLNSMASPSSAYTASTGDLSAIFTNIAGQIGAAVQNAVVSDPMGQGFEIPVGEVTNITTSQGSATYANKTINWNPGTLTTPIDSGSDIKYAEMTYRIEINDDILGVTPDENGEYATNGETVVNYVDVDGNQRTDTFPVPKVNPVLYKVVKILKDKDGNEITADRNFSIDVIGPGKDGADTVRKFVLNTSTTSGTKLMTDLRYQSTYGIEEAGNLDDYEVSYVINGEAATSFYIADNNTEDVTVEVINKEKPGTLTVTKILDQSPVAEFNSLFDLRNSRGISLFNLGSVSFDFTITGPNNYSETFTLPENNSWTKTFEGLAKGEYTVTETTTGYTTSYQINDDSWENGTSANVEIDIGALNQSVTFTNQQTENMEITGTKEWSDNSPTDKPDIWFQLIRVSEDDTETKIGLPRKVTGDTVIWKQTDSDLVPDLFVRYDEHGNEYEYKIQEVDEQGNDYEPEGYSKTEEGLSITNNYSSKIDIPVRKVWDDADNQDGVRPESVTIKLLADGVETDETLVLNETNNWTGEFTSLDEYASGEKIVYTVEEVAIGKGYTPTITGDATEGYIVTNSRTPETVAVEGSKTWDDADNQDGKRPTSITVRLFNGTSEVASKTVGESDGWAWSFTDLAKYEAGVEITYTITEDAVTDYNTTVSGYNVTNSYTPGKIDIPVSKVWADANNQDGVRPEDVTIKLLAGGSDTGKTLTLTETNNWTGTFTGLDEYASGEKIVYTVEEVAIGNGYSTSYDGEAATGYIVTNSRTPELIDIEGSKTWDDADNQDGKRPTSITIRLFNGTNEVDSQTIDVDDGWAWSFTDLPKYEAGVEIIYTITEDAITDYNTTVSGYNVTNSYTPGKIDIPVSKVWDDANNQDGVRPEDVTIKLLADGVETGETLTLTAVNNWTGTFTDLDEYKAGVKIVYTVEELAIGNGYTTTITGGAATGYTVTNSRTPELIDIEGSKTWDDADNQDGKRPTSITIRLFNGTNEVDSTTVDVDDGWSWSFTDLPKYEAGVEIVYTITEDAITDYNTTVSGYNVTNSYTPGKTSVGVTKAWADGNNQDGVRPEDVTIKLLADGVETGETLTLTAVNNWTGTFTDLDEYKAGVKIVYTVEEVAIGSGYTTTITGDVTEGYTVTNSRTPELIDIEGSKTWEDADNQDGKRPTSIIIRLFNGTNEVDSQTVDVDDGWAWSFTDLPKYEAGVEIIYTITEDAITDYNTTVSGYNVTNSYTPGKTSVGVTKAWADANNQDGVRPEDVTIKLLADGVDTGETLTLTAVNNWTGTFTDLDEYKAGVKIVYTVEEVAIGNGYTTTITGDVTEGYIVTNSRTPELIDIEGSKTWDDADNQDGKRPTSITIRLFNGTNEVDSQTVDVDDGWAWSFTDLPKYEAGVEIIYTITEDAITDYNTTVSGYNVTNSYTPGKTSVGVTKAWADGNNQDGVRPEDVTIKLLADGVDTGETLTLTAINNWTGTFTDLDEYKAGVKIVYTVEEVAIGSGYTTTITGDVTEGYIVTNSRTPELIDIEGSKTWEDADNQDGKRPTSIIIRLFNGTNEVDSQTVDVDDGWAWSFTDLPKYEAGVEIIYTITEDAITDYNTTVSGYNVTNSYTPGKTSVGVTKAWADGNNQDGVRPEDVTIKLLADGVDTGETLTLTAVNNWTGTFTDLDEYKAGVKIVYTVEEVAIGSGYTTTITGDATEGYTVTNSRTPELIDIEGSKTWDDADNQDGKRPTSIIIRLFNGTNEVDSQTVDVDDGWAWSFTDLPKYEAGVEIVYTITEDAITDYNTTVSGYNVTNSYTPGKTSVGVTKAWADGNNQDGVRPEDVTIKLLADGVDTGETLTLTAVNNWTGTFTDLDEYKAGVKIVYTVEEVAIGNGYTTTITGDVTEGYTVTNSRTPELIDIEGSKTWDDADNQDGKRPTSITIRLFNGTDEVDSQTVDVDDGWAWSFTDLPKYEAGVEIVYTITEDAITDYNTTVSGYNVTNSYTPGKTSVGVTKAWADGNNQDGVRPEDVTIKLLADGVDTGETLTLTAINNWTGTFTDLDEYKAGVKIVYMVEEVAIGNGYTTTITGDATEGYIVTNSRTPELIDIEGSKTWDDADNQDGKRPTSITIRLFNGTNEVDSQTVDVDDGWAWSFTDLPKYEAGVEIVYTITEDAITDYNTTVSGYNVTNSYTPGKIDIPVSKVWDDANNQDGVRPEDVTIKLLADGVETGETLTLTAINNWTGTFTDLDEYKAGVKIVYTVEEVAIGNGYTTTITGGAATGYTVTNSRTPELIDIEGSKTWDDADNQDGKRPTSITIRLFNGTNEVDSQTVDVDDGWAWSFTDLPKYEAGVEIVYTITEDAITDYNTTVSGYNVTNSYTPGKTSVGVTKAWADGNNQDGVRPEDVTIKLLADGVDTGETLTLTAVNNWTGTFTDLDEYKDGSLIDYTVEEVSIGNGYTTTITGDATEGYTVTNSRTPELIDIEGSKTWDDADNQDGKRPTSIIIRLFNGTNEVDSQTVDVDDGWAWSFTDLPKYEAGVEIIYTITEDAITDYNTTVSGYNVTNSYTPGKTSVGVTKAWADGNNQDGVRPEDVTIKLLADGVDTGETLTLTAVNNWTGTFTDLDEYKAGVKIVYTVEEVAIGNGYTTTITGDVTEGYIVTNSRTPELIDIEGSKTWDDADNQDGKRPTSITIRLFNGTNEVDSQTVDVDDGWAWSFTDLPKYEAGVEIIYTITEDAITDYNTTVSGYNVTNSYTPGKTSVGVTKAWADGNNQDGVRPEDVTIKLLADGVDTGETLTLTAINNWTGTFTDLDEYKAGVKIVYTVEEVAIGNGYTTTITGDVTEGYIVTNSRTPELIDIEGSKTWDDADNQDGKRPTSIIIRLFNGTNEVDSQTVDVDDGWAWSFTDLPKYEAGVEIIYTITEDVIAEYSATVYGHDITNSYTPGKTSVQVTKAWADANNQDNVRPEDVTIKLLADGVDTGETLTLTAINNWTGTFTDLDEYKDGLKIDYTVEEEAVGNGYVTSITGTHETGYTVINSRTPEMVAVEGSKTWNDTGNQSGKRPDSITIRLLKNGSQTDSKTVNEDSGWSWSFTDLPKYEAGEKITYTITEDAVASYSSELSGYDVTNTYTPDKTSVQVTKAWADGNNKDGVRPQSVTIKLIANAVDTGKTLILSEANNWTGTFTDLDEYKDGLKIVYKVEEVKVKKYTTCITGDSDKGFIVTNSHEPIKKPGKPITRTGENRPYQMAGILLLLAGGSLFAWRRKRNLEDSENE